MRLFALLLTVIGLINVFAMPPPPEDAGGESCGPCGALASYFEEFVAIEEGSSVMLRTIHTNGCTECVS